MRTSVRIGAGAALLAAGLGAGCGGDDNDQGRAVPPDAAAVVDGVTVPRSPIDRQVKVVYREASKSGRVPTPEQLRDLRRHLTNGRIEAVIRRQEAKAEGLKLKGTESEEELLYALVEARTGPPKPPTTEQIKRYYKQHQSEFYSPEGRTLRAVTTSTHAKAVRAQQEAQTTHDWPAIVRKYSAFEASKRVRHPGEASLNRQDAPEPLRTAVFNAPLNEVQPPLKLAEGWLVFEVVGSTPRYRRSLTDMTVALSHVLTSNQQQRDLTALMGFLSVKYRPKAVCSEDYPSSYCRNTPKTPPQPATTAGE